jgi:rsbT co-antagonist protein RsbR
MTDAITRTAEMFRKSEPELLRDWLGQQLAADSFRPELMREDQLREESRSFLSAFIASLQTGAGTSTVDDAGWAPVRSIVSDISRARARLGFTASETATFLFSLKEPLFACLQKNTKDHGELLAANWAISKLLDRLGLVATETYQKVREEVIVRQQEEMLELSTPVVELWDGILALPLIGTLDSARTQVVMETLLQRFVDTGAGIAIIDITGVPTVDTLVAQHLLKTVAAARLMGAECIISGIRPQIAQTIVHLGVDLEDVVTKATLADAFAVALKRNALRVGPA